MPEKIPDVDGRVERMIRWLRENEPRITRPKKGKVTFDFAGPSLTARIEDVQEKI